MSALIRTRRFLAGLCLLAASGAAQADFIDEWVNGFYLDSGDSRRGLGMHFIRSAPEQGVLFIAYYTYDSGTGDQIWTTGAAIVNAGDFEVDFNLSLVEGGDFGAAVGSPVERDFASATLTMNACNDFTFAVSGATGPDQSDFSNTQNSVLQLTGGVPNSECVYQQAFEGCPDFASEGVDPRSCIIAGGEYTDDLWLTNDTIWVLNGAVFIGEKDSADNTNTLYVEPGTRIVGAGQSLLGILRGARIMAEGVPHAPIVMTGQCRASESSEFCPEGGASGDWGGLTINGNAPLNTCSNPGQCTSQGEGDSGTYGGDDPYDSSGVLRYARVQFAGIKFTDENELNGIAFQGVGMGTVIENVQVHANQDDGVEFFGGTVNARNLVLTDIEDDSVDWTEGWQGQIQGLVVRQNADTDADRGIEADNLEGDNDATPRAMPYIANATFVGTDITTGATFRRGTGVRVTNAIFTDFENCIDIDDAATFANAGSPPFPGGLSGGLIMENTIVNCGTNFVEEDGDAFTVEEWFTAQPGNMEMDPMLNGIYPPADAAFADGFDISETWFPVGSFFNNLPYIGAFASQGAAWTHTWTLQEFDFE